MKRFYTKKTFKVSNYKFIIFLIVIIGISFSLNIIFKQVNYNKIQNNLINNSFGNLFLDNKDLNKKENFFYRNVFGLPFFKSDVVSGNVNLEEFKKEPLIYIYNTFQTDKYTHSSYSSYSINPVVVQASLILQENLKKLGINSLVLESSVAKVLNDNNISYNLSYRGSRILMEEAYNKNPSLKYFLDIGISDDAREVTTYISDNNAYAKILFIVGTDYDNKENQKLARDLNQILEQKNKNISRGVSLRGGTGYHGVYNQDFNPNTLLIYVGGHDNTIAEVNRSLEVLAEVLKEYIEENNDEEEQKK